MMRLEALNDKVFGHLLRLLGCLGLLHHSGFPRNW